MKSRLHRIEIRNFKAFREFTLDLEGRHLLVYGANGAGKKPFSILEQDPKLLITYVQTKTRIGVE
jgi:predicted ATP-binding protein involved in virulence